jgi:hypothetical protein
MSPSLAVARLPKQMREGDYVARLRAMLEFAEDVLHRGGADIKEAHSALPSEISRVLNLKTAFDTIDGLKREGAEELHILVKDAVTSGSLESDVGEFITQKVHRFPGLAIQYARKSFDDAFKKSFQVLTQTIIQVHGMAMNVADLNETYPYDKDNEKQVQDEMEANAQAAKRKREEELEQEAKLCKRGKEIME